MPDRPAPAGLPGRWAARASLPVPTSESSGGAALGGRLHVGGGWIEHDEHRIHDPASDRWSRGSPLPRPGNHIPVAADAERFYAPGGFVGPNRDPSDEVFAYGPDRDRWTAVAPLPGARDHLGVAVHQGRLHACGGRFNTPAFNTGLHHVYLPDQHRWETAAPMPAPRHGSGLALVGDEILVAGGAPVAGGSMQAATNEAFTPSG